MHANEPLDWVGATICRLPRALSVCGHGIGISLPSLRFDFSSTSPSSLLLLPSDPPHHLDNPATSHIQSNSAMAPPPKPATPPDSSTNKKQVTPKDVAYLVDRYLADNGFNAALAAFRSDAARIYSPTKKTPKRPMPLAEILNDYISLRASRIAIESAMQAMHSLVSTYYASSSSTPPPVPPHVNLNMNTATGAMVMPPLPPLHAATGAQPSSPPLFFAPNSSSPPSQGTAGHASPVIHHYAHASTAFLVHNSLDLSTPAPASLPANKKRKAAKSSGKSTASAAKRSCIAPATTTDAKGTRAVPVAPHPSKDQKMASAAQPTSAQHSVMPKLPLQTSSVAKSLFRPLPPPAHSSPQQSNPIHNQPAAYPSATAFANAHAQQDIASSQCSIVSSKTLIVSPLKGSAYYAVERSYHVSSPLKPTTRSSPLKPTTRKLDFDCTEPGPSEQICDKVSTSSDEDKQYDFDIDFTNFDICDGEFSFSELLVDFDLDDEGVPNPSTCAEVQRLEPVATSGHMAVDPVLPDSVKPVAADSAKDLNPQGATSVTSVRAITKRIKIVSPVKGQAASS